MNYDETSAANPTIAALVKATRESAANKEAFGASFIENLKREDFDTDEAVSGLGILPNWREVNVKIMELEPEAGDLFNAVKSAPDAEVANYVSAFRALSRLGRIAVWTSLIPSSASPPDIERAKVYHKNFCRDILSAFDVHI